MKLLPIQIQALEPEFTESYLTSSSEPSIVVTQYQVESTAHKLDQSQ